MKNVLITVLLFALVICLAGCNSTTKITETMNDQGTVTKRVTEGSYSATYYKHLNVQMRSMVVKALTTDTTTFQTSPEVILGQQLTCYQSSPKFNKDETNPPQYQFMEDSSCWGMFKSKSILYTGVANMSADDNLKLLETLTKLSNSNITTESK